MARKKAPTRRRYTAANSTAALLLAELREGRDRAEANAESARRSAAIAAASGPAEPEPTDP